MKLLHSSMRKVRSMSAVALTLWFAGAACVFVSYARGGLGAEACLTTPSATSHHSTATLSPEAADTSAASPVETSDNVVVAAGAHSSCEAKRAASEQAKRRSASASAAPAIPVQITVARSPVSQSPKPACPSRGQSAQPKGEIVLTRMAPAFGGTLPPCGSMNCCPLSSPFATIATKPRSDDNASATTPERTALPEFFSKVQTTPLTPPLRLPNRGHTYLRCCAFLI